MTMPKRQRVVQRVQWWSQGGVAGDAFLLPPKSGDCNMHLRSLALLCFFGLSAVDARADVVLNVNDATVDWGTNLIDPGYIRLVGEPTVSMSQLSPVPGWTGVKISDLSVTWEIVDADSSLVPFLDVEFGGTASGLVVTERVLIDWSDLRITGPGLNASNFSYNVLFFAYYPESHGGQAEGQGGDANGNPNGSFWLDTSIGSQNQTQIESWRAQVIVNFAEDYIPMAGDIFTLEIGGHSLHGGSNSVLSNIPEPSSCLLIGVAAATLICRRKWARSSCTLFAGQ
jgi:hypothetical protein